MAQNNNLARTKYCKLVYLKDFALFAYKHVCTLEMKPSFHYSRPASPKLSDDLRAGLKATVTLFIRKPEIMTQSVCLCNIVHWGNYEFLLQPQSYI